MIFLKALKPYFFFLFFILTATAYGQIDIRDPFITDTVPDLDLAPDSLVAETKKKKKKKKKVFYGLKCKKSFTRNGVGARETVEIFFYLKEHKDPNPYIPDIYVWDMLTGRVLKIDKLDIEKKPNYKVLHGPYKKMVGGEIVETGIFYIGAKHGRWEKYSNQKTETFNDEEITYSTLIDKTKYYKGWPKEAKISYYDAERKKVKEVIPYEHGILQGDYYFFLENGQILEKGEYKEGKKVGVWVEYFKDRNRRMRETEYPKDPHDTETQPFVKREWDEKGNLIIEDGKKVDPKKSRPGARRGGRRK